MTAGRDRLFTARFFAMCAFSFTVFLSAFQLLPTAPYRILALGGGKVAAGLFLGFLTYASALSAPLTGAIADRVGKRRMLIVCSLAIAGFSAAYAVIGRVPLMLALVLVHGIFWSGLLSASSAYITDFIPVARRAEGISYWGLATNLAVAVAPPFGFWVYAHGWAALCSGATALNLAMAAIAWKLPPDVRAPRGGAERASLAAHVEWRVLAISLTLFLYSFGYGTITSFVALFADSVGVTPRGVFFTTFALTVIAIRPFSGTLSDRIGYRRVFLPSLAVIAVGLTLLAMVGSRGAMITAAVVFGTGFGTAYPAFVALLIAHVSDARRGAAFGSILAAFDIGIGTGSVSAGWIVERAGFPAAFGGAALLSTLAIPYFLVAEKRLLVRPV